MPEFSTMTSDKLLDRLGELERDVDVPQPGGSVGAAMSRLYARMKEVALIHIELARRTATGWRPL